MTTKRNQIRITIFDNELIPLSDALGKIANFSGVLKMTEDEYNVIKTVEVRLRKFRALQLAKQLIDSGQA